MSNSEKKISLPSEAVKIYQIIDENGNISIRELEKQTKLDRGKLEYYLGFLVTNELISRLEIVSHQISLTNNGKEAAENQLVERRIAKILKEKVSVSFADLSKLVNTENKEMNAGVGLLKKQGLIKIDKGQIIIIDKKKEVNRELQIILEQLLSGETADTSDFNEILLQRNLASLEEVKDILLEILIPYKEVSSSIQKMSEVSRLTPEMIRDGSWRDTRLREYNLKASPPTFYGGRKQPYAEFLDEVKQKLCALGFKEMRGPIVELEFWNFDALFQAQNHSAREWSDVYQVSNPKQGKLPKADYVENVKKAHENGYDTGSKGWGYKWDPLKSAHLVLRAHGTSVSARTLVDLEVPSKYFSISRCYRPDTVDATHLSEFTQVEGIVVDPSITFRDLLGILKSFAVDIAENENFKFKPDYYPFTEPSVELDVLDPNLGWIEFGGAGIFRPEVTKPFGIEAPVIAWGLGIERLFMVKNGITDIRELFSHKFDWLRTAKMSRG
ncbi:MAG: phenylalanine--tRNA ligase subunit alpha [Candidatus Heimdallarchaeota archaeon]|nr:phenylalanine--tRNA ligase subunit alpha [Candidatus Heimdallarchaeota archaeon]MCG3257875.1 phenylalanine--tRNA ligase subunit alpha [Candidatus Heimdallarchaeota archaeon]MCK4612926.1 phenylalanine--tRNA ligase subunit alpha [Candidatus Heimdallarchaeota archaeon]